MAEVITAVEEQRWTNSWRLTPMLLSQVSLMSLLRVCSEKHNFYLIFSLHFFDLL
jgi:hypothetical protein